jgi:hypothetical protein
MITASFLGVALLCATLAPADDDAKVIAAQGPFYPIETCVVSEHPLEHGDGAAGADANSKQADDKAGPFEIVVDKRLFRLCSAQCVESAQAQPARYAGMLDKAVAQAQFVDYPLWTCPLSDEPLPPSQVLVVIGSRLVKLCCEKCLHSLRIDPSPAFAALDKAHIAAQKATYPLKTCPISGNPLGKQPHKLMFGNQLVELCCSDCVSKFEAAPHKTLHEIAAALPERKTAPSKALKLGPIMGLVEVVDGEAPSGRGRGR